MNTEEKQQQLHDKKEKIRLGGGQTRIAKQHQKGKMTARERIEYLLDQDSFNELNIFMHNGSADLAGTHNDVPGEGVVVGYGTIDGRLVYLFSQDFTAMGGSLGEAHAKKICTIMDLALETGAPIIGLNDSGGARIQEGVSALDGYGDIFYRNTMASGVVPQLSVIMGPCAGGAVYSPAITDFILMVDQSSRMFITGPQVIKTVTGEELSPEELGGARTHNSTSGVAHLFGSNEQATLDHLKKLLTYLPNNYQENPPEIEPTDPGDRCTDELLAIVPGEAKKIYDVHQVIEVVVDQDSFFEIHPHYARNAVVGFARLNGRSIGIIANQPQHLAGCLDINASDKIARFIRFCDSFNIPLITLVDVPGFLPGSAQEYNGIIRHGAKVLYAYSEATVPKITLVMRKAYGGAYVAMGSKSVRADLVYAWPIAEIAVMGPEGAASIIYRKELKESANSQELLQEKINEYRQNFANPYVAARRGMVHDVIRLGDTRTALVNALAILAKKKVINPGKKHGNIPL